MAALILRRREYHVFYDFPSEFSVQITATRGLDDAAPAAPTIISPAIDVTLHVNNRRGTARCYRGGGELRGLHRRVRHRAGLLRAGEEGTGGAVPGVGRRRGSTSAASRPHGGGEAYRRHAAGGRGEAVRARRRRHGAQADVDVVRAEDG
ncbi:hypothetical protein [Oryza sativa Japonica Group]|uniref:Uncharacterized protein n=1 Tax=Oryza sativa subsp. japonica TaxID=39947 RepID=Q5N8E1_ORYSJ|nr:hypothetical protein [Oryza sativa Japonica Group]BAD82268.1 hypothetical protein [Oryza sativa Japonica Group]